MLFYFFVPCYISLSITLGKINTMVSHLLCLTLLRQNGKNKYMVDIWMQLQITIQVLHLLHSNLCLVEQQKHLLMVFSRSYLHSWCVQCVVVPLCNLSFTFSAKTFILYIFNDCYLLLHFIMKHNWICHSFSFFYFILPQSVLFGYDELYGYDCLW